MKAKIRYYWVDMNGEHITKEPPGNIAVDEEGYYTPEYTQVVLIEAELYKEEN